MNRRALFLLLCSIVAACVPNAVPTQSPRQPASIAPTPAAVNLDWTRASLPDTQGRWSANGVLADVDGFVVYGGINDVAAVWTSVDAATWQSVALPGRAERASPAHAAASADSTVLLGVGGTSECAHPQREYIWQRVRGDVAWSAAPFNQDLFCAGGLPDLAATGDGFAITGRNAGEVPFAWHSVDGLAWQDASHGLPVDSPPALVTATDTGFLFLGRGGRTLAEASVDGRSWSPVVAPPVPPAFNPNGAGMLPEVLIDTASGPLAIFDSDDGTNIVSAWRRLPDASWAEVLLEPLAPFGRITGGVSISDRTYLFLISGGRGRLVLSTDLVAWADVTIPPLSSINELAAFGGRLVLVGSVSDLNGETKWQVWVAEDAPPGS